MIVTSGSRYGFFFINGLTTAFFKAIGTVPYVRLRLLKHRQKNVSEFKNEFGWSRVYGRCG